jgi:Asp-tRNA(Asn)/Glu-tRNA(Gln) amidotransferase A subunit family amidase
MALAASITCTGWRPVGALNELPKLGVPDGPYLAQASQEALAHFEQSVALLAKAGYRIRRVPVLQDIEGINRQHSRIVFAQMAWIHTPWFERYSSLYRPRTFEAIREGQGVSEAELAELLPRRIALRNHLEDIMTEAGIDLWICPATTGPAPEGLTTTGSPLMNLPWTYTGLPAVTVPAGRAANGLPLGLQCVGRYMRDEWLLAWAEGIEGVFSS